MQTESTEAATPLIPGRAKPKANLSRLGNASNPTLRSPPVLRTSPAVPEAAPADKWDYKPVRASWLGLHFKGLLFLLLVVAPACAATVYYCWLASPQYVTEFDLGIRMADPTLTSFGAAAGAMGGQSGGSSLQSGSTLGATVIGLESYVVTQFMTSRSMVDLVDKKIGLRNRFDGSKLDYLSRLDPKAGEERFVSYWQNMIDAYFDLTTGIINVKVRAFTPQDSLDIAKAVTEFSEKRVSEMRNMARDDELRGAKAEVAHAEERVAKARKALHDLRDTEQVYDPQHTVSAVTVTADKLRDDIAGMEAQAKSLGKTMSLSSPAMDVLETRIAATKAQLANVEAQITDKSKSDSVLAAVVNRFNQAQSEETFAENAYQASLSALETAVTTADRDELFLVPFVDPAIPDLSVYPDTLRGIATVMGFALVAWLLASLVIQSVRDHAL